MKWFKHDANASRDSKLRRVRMKYGMAGYGLYWHCIEVIVDRIDVHNVTFELEDDSEIISLDTGISRELVEEMMGYMVELGLFESSNGTITCLKLAKRIDQSMTSNPKMREMIKKYTENHDGVMMLSSDSHDGVMTESCKKRKEKKRIDSNGRFSPPTLDQVKTRIAEMGYSVDAERFINHYQSNGWRVGKNSMKCWKSALANWNSSNKDQPSQSRICGL